MRDNEIKIFEQGRERETIRGLTLSQMYVISAILKRCGASHKTFTYRDGQLASVDWVEAPDLRAALGALEGEADKMRQLLIEVTPLLYRDEIQGHLHHGLMDKVQAWLQSAAPDKAIQQARAALAAAGGEAEPRVG